MEDIKSTIKRIIKEEVERFQYNQPTQTQGQDRYIDPQWGVRPNIPVAPMDVPGYHQHDGHDYIFDGEVWWYQGKDGWYWWDGTKWNRPVF